MWFLSPPRNTQPAHIEHLGRLFQPAHSLLSWFINRHVVAVLCLSLPPIGVPVIAQTVSAATPATLAGAAAETRGINDWLIRMHGASRDRSYIGTFVVSAAGAMSSARIWHVSVGDRQVERVEALTGPARSVFRHNDQVLTFLPASRVVRSERRESLGLFPDLLKSADSSIAEFYGVRWLGTERVAGVDSEVVELLPKDKLRFGYKVWVEQKAGLVVKLQTLDAEARVLEQAAFSELQLDAPVNMDKLVRMMNKQDGYRIEKPTLVKTLPSDQGWRFRAPPAGFKPITCQKRVMDGAVLGTEPMQCIFSDGLATVSIFMEPSSGQSENISTSLSLGATQTLVMRVDPFLATLVGEVPQATLRLFAATLERRK
jgi:sigma-E factor negative regulatory protein RseB